jgi:hypothetical protein
MESVCKLLRVDARCISNKWILRQSNNLYNLYNLYNLNTGTKSDKYARYQVVEVD